MFLLVVGYPRNIKPYAFFHRDCRNLGMITVLGWYCFVFCVKSLPLEHHLEVVFLWCELKAYVFMIFHCESLVRLFKNHAFVNLNVCFVGSLHWLSFVMPHTSLYALIFLCVIYFHRYWRFVYRYKYCLSDKRISTDLATRLCGR